jgi:glycine/D-amino acid oxidase-like deaminating enzyme
MIEKTDITIVGGGFFGLYIADYFSRLDKKVLVIEKESDVMQIASYTNQARVHNGYHYPRSILTASRSRISFPRFVDEFESSIESDFESIYMVSSRLGNVSPKQFEKFCNRIGASIESPSKEIKSLVRTNMIDGIFKTKEFAFNAVSLKKTMLNRIKNNGVKVLLDHEVASVRLSTNSKLLDVCVKSGGEEFNIRSNQVYNCTYSMLNTVLAESKIEVIPLKYELAEMCIIDVPDELKKIGITVMCGPFFSTIPFPSKSAHSLSHVRYTPHFEWDHKSLSSDLNPDIILCEAKKNSAFKKMKLDAQRYIPIMEDISYRESLWAVKTILPRSESDDSRPILFKDNYGLPGLHCVMGGKIDNVYDVLNTINNLGLDL